MGRAAPPPARARRDAPRPRGARLRAAPPGRASSRAAPGEGDRAGQSRSRGARARRRPERQVTETSCPHCGEPVDPRQLVCLSCGGRIALRERAILGREPLPAAALVFILIAAMSGLLLGLGLSSLTGGDDD